MKNTLKILLSLFVVYHLFLGFAGLFFTSSEVLVLKALQVAFNFNISLDSQTIWIIKVTSAYMLVAGAMGVIAVSNPKKYINLVYLAAAFMFIRVFQRALFSMQGDDFIINSNPLANFLGMFFLFVYGSTLIYLAKKSYEK